MKRFLTRYLTAALLALGLSAGGIAPALASINPTITLISNSPLAWAAIPGLGRIVIGTITFGSSDTYTTGGFTITAAQLNGANQILNFQINSPTAVAETSTTVNSNGSVTVKLGQQMQGTSEVTAGGTTKTVTVAGLTANDVISANTPIFCSLDDAATGGGGTGTWAVTDAVSSCKYVSGTTFTLTVIAAAPTNNGNFTYFIPTLAQEMTATTPIASYVLPFTAIVQ